MYSKCISLAPVIHREHILICVFKMKIKNKTHSKEICFLVNVSSTLF